MSDFIVEIIEENRNSLQIETSFVENQNTTVEISSTNTIEISNTDKLLASDFPDFYHTKIIDFNTAVSGLLPSGQSVSVTDVQQIIGLSGIIPGSGIGVYYDSSTGLTQINSSGLSLGGSTFY